MKPILIPAFAAILLLSCDKEPDPTCSDGIQNQEEVYTDCGGPCSPCPILYPENGSWGSNLLYGSQDTLHLTPSSYSLKADVPPGSSLKIQVTSLGGDMWLYGTNSGWQISTPTNSQTFEVIEAGTANVVFNLNNGSGTASMDYFENGTSITKSKVIVWD